MKHFNLEIESNHTAGTDVAQTSNDSFRVQTEEISEESLVVDEYWSPKDGFTLCRVLTPWQKVVEEIAKQKKHELTDYEILKANLESSDSRCVRTQELLYLELPKKRAFGEYFKQLRAKNISKQTPEICLVIYVDLPNFYWFEIIDEPEYTRILGLHRQNKNEEIMKNFIELEAHIERIRKSQEYRARKNRLAKKRQA